MRVSVDMPGANFYRVFSNATNEEIPFVVEADTDAGTVTVLRRVDGHFVPDPDPDGYGHATDTLRGIPFRIVHVDDVAVPIAEAA
jgi:hypothetical protein